MVSINYATREVSCKIVYYGPGLSGKTTNLQYVHSKVPAETKGKLISLATDADRTLYFDFLPINIGTINGFATKFQLYTVPGQVYYNATRKLVLRGVDGIVFVADSQPDKMDENIESLNNLKENLLEYGYKLEELPIVIQYNKQDLPGVLSQEKMHAALNPTNWPEYNASATEGFGIFDTLKCILKLVLDRARTGSSPSQPDKPVAQPAAVAASVPQPQAAAPVQPVWTQPQAAPTAPSWQTQPVEPARPAAAAQAPAYQPQPQAPEEAPAYYREAASAPQETSSPAYRPFPGNTVEEEEKMRINHHPIGLYNSGRIPRPGPEVLERQAPPQAQAAAAPGGSAADMPRMAPSLKVDKTHKKRPFWKRLFGIQ
jgi:mutual gliding-motility protein MglA